MNEEEENEEEEGERAITGETTKVVPSPIQIIEDLPPPAIQVNVISTYCEVHVVSITLCIYVY